MADYTKYPTGADLEVLLKSVNAWPDDSLTTQVALAREQAQIAADGAAFEFERSTGWLPFLAKETATARPFDGTDESGVLDLKAGLLASPAPIAQLTVGNKVYQEDISYWLQPATAPDQGLPYTRLQFIHSIFGGLTWSLPNRMTITGRWGYCDSLPPDVWVAIQKKGAVELLASMENLQDIASISQDGFSKSYDITGVITQSKLLEVWGVNFKQYVTRYTRITV